ncbi:hypothetical protein Y032_0070g405 [Ancylostoma ceylanicum]|uniref:Uncharacterized protein n=1 Tax=Ancylostoma ceylanicum TaxID=53326 RepID=A0A016TX77_9BILA|nr:hypothetical protein Y032_0070g405 [Ancylostoma ceylanicum]
MNPPFSTSFMNCNDIDFGTGQSEETLKKKCIDIPKKPVILFKKWLRTSIHPLILPCPTLPYPSPGCIIEITQGKHVDALAC